jgi:hypothetical protein
VSNVLANSGKGAILAAYVAAVVAAGHSFRIVLVDDADYTYSSAHDNLDDIPSGARVATSGDLASITTTNGVFDSADVTLTAVSGDPVERVVLDRHTGTASTSTILAQYDTASGLTLTPNGGDVIVAPGGSGWFSL